ncbi:MAG: chloride channel protein, partial [bacterium]
MRQESRADLAELRLGLLSLLVGLLSYFLGRALLASIYLTTNVLFYGHWSFANIPPSGHLPLWAALIPAAAGLVIGVIARYGSPAVRGHGIPEMIETVLVGESKVPFKVAVLKPLCSALSIGSGGPFGAEGPVIGMGGSIGSLLGQWLSLSTWERKVLLSAGAGAGITAVFGCPIAATLLSLELLLYEFSLQSLVAVGLACAVSGGLRMCLVSTAPLFPVGVVTAASPGAIIFYCLLGLPLGLAAVGITKLVEKSENVFEKLPIHWMWWPALGGLVVGLVGLYEPRVFGPSYGSINDTLDGQLVSWALLTFVCLKSFVWIQALGSGTTGGTLAPLFGIGAGIGALLVTVAAAIAPHMGLDPRYGAMVGMAAVFSGASYAPLASIVLVLETTHCMDAAMPLLGCCALAIMVCHALQH